MFAALMYPIHIELNYLVHKSNFGQPVIFPFLYFYRILHKNGFSQQDLEMIRPVVYSNTIQSILAILRAMYLLNIEFGDADRQVDLLYAPILISDYYVICFLERCSSCLRYSTRSKRYRTVQRRLIVGHATVVERRRCTTVLSS